MNKSPIKMEEYFFPGFKKKPAVHIGSQTMRFFKGIAKEQAYESWHLAGANGKDVTVVRNFDPLYIEYWQDLMGGAKIINFIDKTPGTFLTESILSKPNIIKQIKDEMHKDSRLMVFLPTHLEEQLALKMGIPLHGSSLISDKYGTKSGIRKLAEQHKISMTPGSICSTFIQIKKAIDKLKKQYSILVLKHDLSLSGLFSKRIKSNIKEKELRKYVNEISGGTFKEGKDTIVVEGWVKSNVSLCAHIEIINGQKPIICAGWQQIIDKDGITYIGAGPLMISKRAINSFLEQTKKLALALQKKGAVGSFGPDFIVDFKEDKCILVELNARVPYTAFPLETVKEIKGVIGDGFCSTHIKTSKKMIFSQVKKILDKNNLLIKKKNRNAKGVVPFNIGLLAWKTFDIIAMADTWGETEKIVKKVKKIFEL